ncbi:hypothetical protein ARMSODRAFT_1003796 [Armillaria solidipes]|uniref:Uncharacterized protein n=1 Tax=Armillaria solidipes TaxID=1076256 RepID=A0A2H3C261_9AGAR|nr:hypothetical protein ARMSODRAFT_1003796 [Armillaria solidipes]
MSLEIGGLYIMLFARYQPGSYHWGLYHYWEAPTNPTFAGKGTKYHAVLVAANWGSWQVDIGETGRALESTLLVGVIKIGYVDPAHRRTLEATLGKVTCTSPSPDIPFTCRIWVLKAVNDLMDVGAVRCDSVKALETEAIAFGNQQASSQGVQPRPIVQSTVYVVLHKYCRDRKHKSNLKHRQRVLHRLESTATGTGSRPASLRLDSIMHHSGRNEIIRRGERL